MDALEELKRMTLEARDRAAKARRLRLELMFARLARVKIPDKAVSIAEGVVVADAGAPGGTDEDAAPARCRPVPRPASRSK